MERTRGGLGWLRNLAHGVGIVRCVGLLAAVVCMAGVMAAAAGGSATEAMKGTIDRVLEILKDKELKKPDRLEERRRTLEKVVAERFSYEEMAKRSLAAQWKELDENQRKEFVELFQSLLTRTYADKVESYSGEPVQYVNERVREEGYAEVRTKVVSGKAEIPLDYRLTRIAGDWRVYDVVIDGVSLVSNYRGQFTKIIKSSSYADLVDKLRKKSDKITTP